MMRKATEIAANWPRLVVLVAGVLGASCGSRQAPPPLVADAAPEPSEPAAAPSASVPRSTPEHVSETPRVSGTGDPPPPAPPETPPAPDPEIPGAIAKVKVKNIGLHVGGGPNDVATKAPFESAIGKHFDDFKRCYGKVEKASARGTFGIDLLIDARGGHPTTSNSRTALPGDAFRDCVAHVFETVVFDPPKHGATKISYALSFEPE